MMSTIIKREISDYMKSSKFLIGLGITVFLITISTLINLHDFKKRHQDYIDAKEYSKKETFYIKVYKPPQPLSILVQEKDRKLGNQIEMTYLKIQSRPSGYMGEYTSQHLRYMSGFEAIDFSFIVRIVLSLMVIFLTYNAISEEKFMGTLRLVLANQLPRDQLILGKFLGGLFVIGTSLIISTLITVIIIVLHPSISLSSQDWIRFLGIIGVSALYLICFFTLSLFISVMVNRPFIALMILLQIWIFLVVIYPNLSVILAENFYELPSEKEIRAQKEAAFKPYEEEFQKNQRAFHEAVEKAKRVPKEIGLKNVELWSIRAEKNYQIDVEFGNKLTTQSKLATTIAFLSPSVLYQNTVSRFARTDLSELDRFMDGVYRHWKKHVERSKLRWIDRQAYRKSKLSEFTYKSESVSESLLATLPYLIILFLFSLIFFIFSYLTFLKKDVR